MSTHDSAPMSDHDYADEPVTVADISAMFGVSVSTVRRLLSDGKLPHATKRRGPKGDEWVIRPSDLTALGYQQAGRQSAPRLSAANPAPDLEAVRAQVAADYERRLVEMREQYEKLLDARDTAHHAQVEQLWERADYERQLREAQGQTLNVLSALLAQSRSGRRALARAGHIELEAGDSAPRRRRRTEG